MRDSIPLESLGAYLSFQVLPLACYVLFIFFAFCDGFGLHAARKILWAVYFIAFSVLSFWATGAFDLRLIRSTAPKPRPSLA